MAKIEVDELELDDLIACVENYALVYQTSEIRESIPVGYYVPLAVVERLIAEIKQLKTEVNNAETAAQYPGDAL